MDERKGDMRIYVAVALFSACLVSGGVLLVLYLFLPLSNVKSWYPIAGMILVAAPWAFWFLTYIYQCIRPPVDFTRSEPYKSPAGSPFPGKEGAAISPRNPPFDDDQPRRPSSDGIRHVHFGGVVVVSDDVDNNSGRHQGGRKHSEIEH
ncbi:hypothetical protein OIU84_027482 [Salix udensis]|uniref:Uncharacterized protein n=1 Tax=Salix udensis TaxID=889485 RepID=A0AAD6KHA4_9ROSI|nr:hypothetical protein OIU84_027482 [Salix udensis]